LRQYLTNQPAMWKVAAGFWIGFVLLASPLQLLEWLPHRGAAAHAAIGALKSVVVTVALCALAANVLSVYLVHGYLTWAFLQVVFALNFARMSGVSDATVKTAIAWAIGAPI